ncbi:acyl carrier protein [Erysipelotrichaceae bacterium]|nr:acyl carrier protein [Erysipelotrichaceae bacterium]
MSAIFEKVKEILVDQLGVEIADIKMESNIQEDLGADSIAVMEVVVEIETEFGMEVPEEELLQIKTVGDIVTRVENSQK